jgi:hypothetical protein
MNSAATGSVARAVLSAGALLGVGAAVGARVHSVARGSWESRRHALELEGVRVIRDSQGVFPQVEITLRNPAPSTSFLTRIEIDVARRSARTQKTRCRESVPAAEYNLLLDPERALEHRSLALSQLVDPHSRHRFAVVVGQTARRGLPVHAEYDLAASILYNEESALPLGTISVAIDGPPCGTRLARAAAPVTRAQRGALSGPR